MTDEASGFVFLGDCNTCGIEALQGACYPQILGERLTVKITNLGLTMATTREALEFSKSHPLQSYDAVFIQYGLVDSWNTIRSAPYVLYYPDTLGRKIARKWVKKWKKYGRKLGLGHVFGLQNQVPISEYRKNLEQLIKRASGTPVYLIETPPNQDTTRNSAIRRYNACLLELSEHYQNVHCVRIYSNLDKRFDTHYHDATHLSIKGHEVVANKILKLLHKAGAQAPN